MKTHIIAMVLIAAICALLAFWGVQMLFIPKAYMAARGDNAFLYYEGHLLIALALLMAWFRGWLAQKMLWLFQEMHRWISALLMAGVVGTEGIMHVLNVPHVEGWWIPMLSGGALATAITAWFQKWRKKAKD